MPPLKPNQITVLVDPREQTPWVLAPMKMEEATLQTGDYSAKGLNLDRTLRIERKNFSDFMGCMTSGRDRFERELERLAAFPHRIVIIEGTAADLAAGNYRSRINTNSAVATVMDWWQEYNVGFLFAHDRELAQRYAKAFIFNTAKDAYEAMVAFGKVNGGNGK